MEECCVVCGLYIRNGELYYTYHGQSACSEGCAFELAGIEEDVMGE